MKEFKQIVASRDFKAFDEKRMRKGNILTRVNCFQEEQMRKRGYESTKLIANDQERVNRDLMLLETSQEQREENMLRKGQLRPLKAF
jgi:hypothetical protein